jgi:6-phosphogluconolactonase
MLKIFKDLDELSGHAAHAFVDIAHRSIDRRGRFLTALSGGGTPTRLYEMLGNEFSKAVDWSHVHFFWGDERCVPIMNPGNSYAQIKPVLFDRINVPAGNLHRVRTELAPTEAAGDYARTLKTFSDPPLAWPHFDLVLLGLGEDGHTASLFPGSPVEVESPTLAVTADYHGRPANRVTLTQQVFNSAKIVFFLVSGKSKSTALFNTLKGEYAPQQFPAQRIDPQDGEMVWLVDEEAAGLL